MAKKVSGSIKYERYGYPAYVLDMLVGVRGRNREEVLEYIVNDYISTNREDHGRMGINFENAVRLGYVENNVRPIISTSRKGKKKR